MASAIGPPLHVVKIYGEVANESIRDLFLRVEVSEMKTVKQ
jgi:TRAP-type C4-dicarboxylate transport system permease large subunit